MEASCSSDAVPEPFRDRVSCFLHRPLVRALIIGLVIRAVLAPLLTPNYDMTFWMRIMSMADGGLSLYVVDGYYYTPPWGYFLSFLALLGSVFGITYGTRVPELSFGMGGDIMSSSDAPIFSDIVPTLGFVILVKAFLVIVDLLVAVLLHRLVSERFGDGKAVAVAAAWFLCPLVIVESSVHGMFDCIAALFAVIGIGLVSKRRYALAGAAVSLAMLTKLFAVFLVPLLIAWVLSREGINRKGAASLAKAIVGFAAAFILVELPSIMAGDFWETVMFLTSRASLTGGIPAWAALIAAAVLAAVIVAAWVWCTRNADRVRASLDRLRTPEAERRVVKALGVIAVLVAVAVLVFALATAGWSDVPEAVAFLGSKALVIVYVVCVLFEVYLAYRYLFRGERTPERLAMLFFLGAMAVILWPPLPQYPVFVIPFAAVYVMVFMPSLRKPLFLLGLGYALYDLSSGGITMLYALSEATGLIPMDALVSMSEVLYNRMGDVHIAGTITGVFKALAYLAFLWLMYRWYREASGSGAIPAVVKSAD